MICSQVITMNVIYDDADGQKPPPLDWDWDKLVDEPIIGCVEILAYGPIKTHPRPGREDE